MFIYINNSLFLNNNMSTKSVYPTRPVSPTKPVSLARPVSLEECFVSTVSYLDLKIGVPYYVSYKKSRHKFATYMLSKKGTPYDPRNAEIMQAYHELLTEYDNMTSNRCFSAKDIFTKNANDDKMWHKEKFLGTFKGYKRSIADYAGCGEACKTIMVFDCNGSECEFWKFSNFDVRFLEKKI